MCGDGIITRGCGRAVLTGPTLDLDSAPSLVSVCDGTRGVIAFLHAVDTPMDVNASIISLIVEQTFHQVLIWPQRT